MKDLAFKTHIVLFSLIAIVFVFYIFLEYLYYKMLKDNEERSRKAKEEIYQCLESIKSQIKESQK